MAAGAVMIIRPVVLSAILCAFAVSLSSCSRTSAGKAESADSSVPTISADVALKKGYSLSIEQNYQEAILYLNKSIELDPTQSMAFYVRALAYENIGEDGRAFADYSEALRLKPNSDNALFRRARLFMRQKKTAEAKNDLLEALVVNPKNELAHNSLGVMLLSQKEPDKAIDEFTEAIKIDNTFAAPYYWRSIAYAGKGKKDLADRDMAMALDLGYKPGPFESKIQAEAEKK